MNKEKLIKYFKIACYAECVSCFLLFFIAMPMKYSFDNTILMIPFGIFHGVCFTIYLILDVLVRKICRWDDEDFVSSIMAAFFPFATIWVERSLVKIKDSEEEE
ncbi:MAG: DUF3817 domain-containing protein [Flavobacteriaceae bacterium]|jgi:integral membrane protein|nr:DUF3817 domain-containing protein [Flavobacteriaceae bacterium]